MSHIQPFIINIKDSELSDITRRLENVRYTNEISPQNDDMGLSVEYVKELVDYWKNDYDWRKVEKKLNAIPQFQTKIDGQNIHFVHVKSEVEGATPLLLTHGWPASFIEYVDIIDRLTNPQAHGGKKENAFHVVIPSVPGFAFSGPTEEAGWNRYRIAKAWGELMRRLVYSYKCYVVLAYKHWRFGRAAMISENPPVRQSAIRYSAIYFGVAGQHVVYIRRRKIRRRL